MEMEMETSDRSSRERRPVRRSDHSVGTAASEPRRGPKSCSSHYKGVTKHRRTGRWEAHIWGRAVNKGPGKQIYLGGFVTPEEAAEAHDLAALQLQGPNAKTNFHISKYADWLATLQATPSEDNLPLQLRRAGMFKRCTDRAKQHQAPLIAGMGPFQSEPHTPLAADARARLSRASDSTQAADPAASSFAYAEREDSINSQSSGAPASLRRPLPVRLSMPLVGTDQRNGANGNMPNPSSALQPALPQNQANGGSYHFLPPGAVSSGLPVTALPLNAKLPPQLAPLGWRSFQALAEEQAAQALQAAMAASQGLPSAFVQPRGPSPGPTEQPPKGVDANTAISQPIGSMPSQVQQVSMEGPSSSNNNATGSFGSTSGPFLGYLTPEQVQWLQASGVKIPDQLPSSLPLLLQQPAFSQPLASLAFLSQGLSQGFSAPYSVSQPILQQAALSTPPLQVAFTGPAMLPQQGFLGSLQSFLGPQQGFLGPQPPIAAPNASTQLSMGLSQAPAAFLQPSDTLPNPMQGISQAAILPQQPQDLTAEPSTKDKPVTEAVEEVRAPEQRLQEKGQQKQEAGPESSAAIQSEQVAQGPVTQAPGEASEEAADDVTAESSMTEEENEEQPETAQSSGKTLPSNAEPAEPAALSEAGRQEEKPAQPEPMEIENAELAASKEGGEGESPSSNHAVPIVAMAISQNKATSSVAGLKGKANVHDDQQIAEALLGLKAAK